jgi:hypothetical protein
MLNALALVVCMLTSLVLIRF